MMNDFDVGFMFFCFMSLQVSEFLIFGFMILDDVKDDEEMEGRRRRKIN